MEQGRRNAKRVAKGYNAAHFRETTTINWKAPIARAQAQYLLDTVAPTESTASRRTWGILPSGNRYDAGNRGSQNRKLRKMYQHRAIRVIQSTAPNSSRTDL